VLDIYEKALGHKLNKEKTLLFFNRNTNRDTKAHPLLVAGVSSTHRYEKYLGLPALIGRSWVSAFSGIKGKIWTQINGWNKSFLSLAGKEILLKAVIQAIPTYTMNVLQLSKTLCKEINFMMPKFLWGSKVKRKRVQDGMDELRAHRKGKIKGGLRF
jgi:hypothetical protein